MKFLSMITGYRVVSLLLVLLAGCGGSARLPEVDEAARTLVYACGDDEFVVHTRGAEAMVYLPTYEYELQLSPSESGLRYTNENDGMLWLRGEGQRQADLDLGANAFRGCQLDRRRIPWEEARRRGVDFRAVGQEPGWSLEIEQGRQILFVYDYASHRLLVPTPEPEQHDAETIYQLRHGQQQLRVELRVEHCQDTMSGEFFDNSVRVLLDEREFLGCGMSLPQYW